IDLTSHIVRVLSSLKIENAGPDAVSEVLFAFPNMQAKNLAAIKTFYSEGKGKGKSPSIALPTVIVQREGMPLIALPKSLEKGKTLNMDMLAVFAHSLTPFPEEITQADVQLLVYQDSAYYLSPYAVKVQSLGIRLPNGRVESYTKYPNTKLVDSELKYGPFESLPPFSYSPIIVHFENNHPFAITEHYTIVHGGARTKGGFSRIDYQMRTNIRGTSSFSLLTALLPPRAHSIYYRDEIGNISTSTLWADSRETQFGIQPRFPIFGGWRTTFTIGYSLPLQDFLFESDGKRVLNITYGCPIQEAVADKLINLLSPLAILSCWLQVVLPEGSKDISASAPFHTKQSEEVKYSHLDIVGRPVVVLEKTNVVPEHNLYFQVFYRFSNLSLLREPLMLASGFFLLFVACIVYMHTDMAISKTSASYLAKLQWDEVLLKMDATAVHFNIFKNVFPWHPELFSMEKDAMLINYNLFCISL
ncbi:Dolichyl-diphosphooligosaccharide--protein glycosyltransferase subunit 1A, partial [Ananas comosus]